MRHNIDGNLQIEVIDYAVEDWWADEGERKWCPNGINITEISLKGPEIPPLEAGDVLWGDFDFEVDLQEVNPEKYFPDGLETSSKIKVSQIELKIKKVIELKEDQARLEVTCSSF